MSLLVAPVFDDITKYSLVWANEIEDWLSNPTVLKGRPITRSEVEQHLKGKTLYIHYGHGSENALWGSHTEAVVDLKNVKLLPKEVYTMSCLTAKRLGVAAWRNGSTYYGYYESFSFTEDSLKEFQEFANCGMKFHLSGESWKEVTRLAKELGSKLAETLISSGRYIASICMRQNVQALRCYNSEAPTESDCFFRRIALKLFGAKGWSLFTKREPREKEVK